MQRFGDKHDAEVDEALRSLCSALADLLNEFKKQQSLSPLHTVRFVRVPNHSAAVAKDDRPCIPWKTLSQL